MPNLNGTLEFNLKDSLRKHELDIQYSALDLEDYESSDTNSSKTGWKMKMKGLKSSRNFSQYDSREEHRNSSAVESDVAESSGYLSELHLSALSRSSDSCDESEKSPVHVNLKATSPRSKPSRSLSFMAKISSHTKSQPRRGLLRTRAISGEENKKHHKRIRTNMISTKQPASEGSTKDLLHSTMSEIGSKDNSNARRDAFSLTEGGAVHETNPV